jgi:hypothetical protein
LEVEALFLPIHFSVCIPVPAAIVAVAVVVFITVADLIESIPPRRRLTVVSFTCRRVSISVVCHPAHLLAKPEVVAVADALCSVAEPGRLRLDRCALLRKSDVEPSRQLVTSHSDASVHELLLRPRRLGTVGHGLHRHGRTPTEAEEDLISIARVFIPIYGVLAPSPSLSTPVRHCRVRSVSTPYIISLPRYLGAQFPHSVDVGVLQERDLETCRKAVYVQVIVSNPVGVCHGASPHLTLHACGHGNFVVFLATSNDAYRTGSRAPEELR